MIGPGRPGPRIKQPVGRLILAQLLDGLFPFTLLLMSVLALAGLVPGELVFLAYGAELLLFVVISALVSSQRLLLLPRLLVAIPLRLIELHVGLSIYFRVGTDILTGNRDCMK